jgi:outer membrane lipoprotein SlyB
MAVVAVAAAGVLLSQSDRVPRGTEVTVRTNESIDGRSPSDFRVYTATIDRDVPGRTGEVLIPRGSQAELILRDADADTVLLDLESITVKGERLGVVSSPQSVPVNGERREGVGANKRTGKYVGGGAAIGAIIGAIAGGGKGAAIGAATGGGAGAVGQTVTRGRNVRLPAESLITFRLDQSLNVSEADRGITRDGHHYHDYYRDRR